MNKWNVIEIILKYFPIIIINGKHDQNHHTYLNANFFCLFWLSTTRCLDQLYEGLHRSWQFIRFGNSWCGCWCICVMLFDLWARYIFNSLLLAKYINFNTKRTHTYLKTLIKWFSLDTLKSTLSSIQHLLG